MGSTSCPGQYGYAKLDQIRAGVAARLADVPTIAGRYASEPDLRATLGSPVGTQQTANGVRWQVYQNGYLVDSAVGGVHLVKGAILQTWLQAGGPFALGGALDDETCASVGAPTGSSAARSTGARRAGRGW